MCIVRTPTGVDDCGPHREAVYEPATVGARGCGDPLLRRERKEEDF